MGFVLRHQLEAAANLKSSSNRYGQPGEGQGGTEGIEGMFFLSIFKKKNGGGKSANWGILIMGPYKPLRTWVDEFIPYYMEIYNGSLDPNTYNCWFWGPVVWIPGIPENERDWDFWGPYPDSNPKPLNAPNQQLAISLKRWFNFVKL